VKTNTKTAMKIQNRKELLVIILKIILAILSILLLIYPALNNGYPLLYSDSATYIVSGHDNLVPIDRPIFYGLFVWNTSMSYSLWIVVLLQSILVVGVVYYTYSLFVRTKKSMYYSFLTILILSLFTGLPNYVCQIMPDLFSGIMIWLIVLFYFTQKLSSRIILGIGTLFCAVVHNSNLITLFILVFLLLLISLISRNKALIYRSVALMTLAVFSWLFVPSVNYLFQHEWFISKSGNVFLMGRLIDTGIAKDFLDDECQNSNYELCLFKDSLPQHSWDFYWNGDSPLYYGDCGKSGWGNCWVVKSNEYGEIIYRILTTPKYLFKFIKISISDSFKQFFYFDMIHFAKLEKDVGLDAVIKQYMGDHDMLLTAKQLNESLFYTTRNLIQKFFVGLSALFIIVWVAYHSIKGRIKRNVLMLLCIVLLGLLINAIVCSTFSCVECRFQGRVIWLMPLISCLLVFIPSEFKREIANSGM
jgi:hypothetical protein